MEKVETSTITIADIPVFEPHYNRHYITTDAQGRIISGWSNGPHPDRDTTGAICINEQGGYQFRLLVQFAILDGESWHQQTEENPPLYTMDGIPLYCWDGEQVVPRTEEEIATDRAKIPATLPTPQEQLRADVDLLLVLQGVIT